MTRPVRGEDIRRLDAFLELFGGSIKPTRSHRFEDWIPDEGLRRIAEHVYRVHDLPPRDWDDRLRVVRRDSRRHQAIVNGRAAAEDIAPALGVGLGILLAEQMVGSVERSPHDWELAANDLVRMAIAAARGETRPSDATPGRRGLGWVVGLGHEVSRRVRDLIPGRRVVIEVTAWSDPSPTLQGPPRHVDRPAHPPASRAETIAPTVATASSTAAPSRPTSDPATGEEVPTSTPLAPASPSMPAGSPAAGASEPAHFEGDSQPTTAEVQRGRPSSDDLLRDREGPPSRATRVTVEVRRDPPSVGDRLRDREGVTPQATHSAAEGRHSRIPDEGVPRGREGDPSRVTPSKVERAGSGGGHDALAPRALRTPSGEVPTELRSRYIGPVRAPEPVARPAAPPPAPMRPSTLVADVVDTRGVLKDEDWDEVEARVDGMLARRGADVTEELLRWAADDGAPPFRLANTSAEGRLRQLRFGVQPDAGEDFWFVGDLHGDVVAFAAIESYTEKVSARSGRRPTLVLLGDLIDDGAHGIELVDHVLGRIHAAPGQTVWILGNHDEGFRVRDDGTFWSEVSPSDFTEAVSGRAPSDHRVDALARAFVALARRAPRALFFEDGLVASHAGFPHSDLWTTIRSREDLEQPQALQDFTWLRCADTVPRKVPNRLHRGCQFGFADFAGFCAQVRTLGIPAARLVRGHDHVDALDRYLVSPRSNDAPILTLNAMSWTLDRERATAAISKLPFARRPALARYRPGLLPEVHPLVLPDALVARVHRSGSKDPSIEG